MVIWSYHLIYWLFREVSMRFCGNNDANIYQCLICNMKQKVDIKGKCYVEWIFAAESEMGDSCVGRTIPTTSYCRAHICCGELHFLDTEKLRRPYGDRRNRTGSFAFCGGRTATVR